MRRVFVGTHHKSGTVWLRRIFRTIAAKEGFKSNLLSKQGNPAEATMAVRFSGRSIMPPWMQGRGDLKMLHLIRDPRDMLISAMHYHLSANEPWLTAPSDQFGGPSYQQRLIQEADTEARLLFEMKHHHAGVVADMLAWPYGDPRSYDVRYEDLIADTEMTRFREILSFLGFTDAEIPRALDAVWRHSLFGALNPVSVQPHQTAHIRSGKAGQWREVFTPKVARAYAEMHGHALKSLGYADTTDWVSEITGELADTRIVSQVPAVPKEMSEDLVLGIERRALADTFREALADGDYDRLAPLVAEIDPFKHTALCTAIDYLLEHDPGGLGSLGTLAAQTGGFAEAVWQALRHYPTRPSRAVKEFKRLGNNAAYEWRFRVSARTWAAFCDSTYFRPDPNATGRGPDIVQFWDAAEVPEDVARLMDDWRGVAGSGHRLCSAAAAADFLRDNFGPAMVDLFYTCPHPAIQSDFFRFGYIAVRGGIYVDADAKMRPDFSTIWPSFRDKEVYWCRTHLKMGQFNNGLLVAPPGAPFMHACFEEAARRIGENPNRPVMYLAGPVMMKDVAVQSWRKGHLSNAQMMSSAFVLKRIYVQVKASYKEDARNWHLWQKTQTFGGNR